MLFNKLNNINSYIYTYTHAHTHIHIHPHTYMHIFIELLALCKRNNLLIANGKIGEYPDGRYTCYTARGQSVVDYLIIDVEPLINVTSFFVNLANPLSDHNSIATTIHFPDHSTSTCPGNVQEDVRAFYRWNTNDVEQYTIAINSDKLQTQLTQLIENIRSASQPNDIDRVVFDVNRVLLEAAESNKVVSKKSKQRKQRKQPRTHQSPWYDKKCESARKLYNSLRN